METKDWAELVSAIVATLVGVWSLIGKSQAALRAFIADEIKATNQKVELLGSSFADIKLKMDGLIKEVDRLVSHQAMTQLSVKEMSKEVRSSLEETKKSFSYAGKALADETAALSKMRDDYREVVSQAIEEGRKSLEKLKLDFGKVILKP